MLRPSYKGGDHLARFVGQDRLKPFARPHLASGTLTAAKEISQPPEDWG